MRLVLGTLLLLLLLGQVDVQIISPILPELSEFFEVSIANAGAIVTVYSVIGGLWALIIGPLSDKFGRLIFLQAAALVMAGASALAYLTPFFSVFLLSRAIAGVAGATISVCIIAQIADMFPYEKRGKAMGLVGAVYAIAAVGGAPVGALIASKFDWWMLYAISFFIALLLTASMYFTAGRLIGSNPLTNGFHVKKSLPFSLKKQIKEYHYFLKNSVTRSGLIVAVVISATATAVVTYLGAWLATDFSMSPGEMVPIYLSLGIATIIGSLFGGWLSDKLGKTFLVGNASLLLAVILFSTIFISEITGVYAFCISGGLVIAMREGPYQALITELIKAEERGAYIALKSTAAKTGIAISAVIGGVLFQKIGFFAVANFAAVCSLIAAVLVFRALNFSSMETKETTTMQVAD
ncbi:MAG: MFS transporter [Deferribacteres bacterium]|nr:MFS transporter [candidate division KSB1 bacterium]MCB9501903.1 MFS transporter [Deferribacteres bacterium]